MPDNRDEDIQAHADWRADAADALERSHPERAARMRGRPKGSTNRKTQDFASWYEAQGYKDPLQLQAEFMSADAIGIQKFFIQNEKTQKALGKHGLALAVPSLMDIVKEQMACARDLAPYLHGKAPAQESQPDERLPMIIINTGTNQLDQAQSVADQRGIRLGFPLNSVSNEINDLAEQPRKSLKQKSHEGQIDE